MKLETLAGFYSLSFFNLHIKSDEDLSLMLKKYTQTFVHEFLHYIQDIILPYNIRLNLTNLSLFSFINLYAIEKGYLTIPFNNWNDESIEIIKQREYTLGSDQFFTEERKIEQIRTDYFLVPSINARVFKYEALLVGKKEAYHLGARDLLEYIVHKIESKHYSIHVPRMPYETVDMLFDYYGLSHINFPVRVLIVEICLYNDNPMHHLINHFLNGNLVKDNIEIFSDYNASYSFLLSYYGWLARGGFSETIFSKRERRLNDFQKYLCDMFVHPQFYELRSWIERVSLYSRNTLSSRFIFSDFYNMDIYDLFDFLSDIIDKIGLPMVLNESYQCISLLPQGTDNLQFAQFLILQNFLINALSGNSSCPIYDFCKANDGMCEGCCKTDPFERFTEDDTCPYLLFLKSYGLADIEFKYLSK